MAIPKKKVTKTIKLKKTLSHTAAIFKVKKVISSYKRKCSRFPKVKDHTNRSLGRLSIGTMIFPNTRMLMTSDVNEKYFYYYVISEYGHPNPMESDDITDLFPGFVLSHHKFISDESRYPYKVTKVRGPGGVFYISSYTRVSICNLE